MRSAPPDKIILKGIISYTDLFEERNRFEREKEALQAENEDLRAHYDEFATAFFACYRQIRVYNNDIVKKSIPVVWEIIRGNIIDSSVKERTINGIEYKTREIEKALAKCQDRIKNELLSQTDDVEGSEL